MSRKTPTAIRSRKNLQLATNSGSIAAPTTDSDGEAVSDVAPRHPAPLNWLAEINSSDDSSPSAVTNAILYGFYSGRWVKIGELNSGNQIDVSVQGYSEIVSYLGLFERIAIEMSVSGGNADMSITPILEVEV